LKGIRRPTPIPFKWKGGKEHKKYKLNPVIGYERRKLSDNETQERERSNLS